MTDTAINGATVEEFTWPEPDFGILTVYRRSPSTFPLTVLGAGWSIWAGDAAEAAACPVDYIVPTLLAAASALIGHARWPEAAPGWVEPPFVWTGTVGFSGDGKTGGSGCLLHQVLPSIERNMRVDYADRFAEWAVECDLA